MSQTLTPITAGDDAALIAIATADLTGCAVYWTLSLHVGDAVPLVECSTALGTVSVSGTSATVTMSGTVTAALPESALAWSLAVRDASLEVHTLASGSMTVAPALRAIP